MSAANKYAKDKIYQVGNLVIDVKLGEVSHGEESYKPHPHVFDTLVYLIENRHREIDIEEFKTSVWHDPRIEEFQYLRNISLARRAILDDTNKQLIRFNAEHNAYRFFGDVFEIEFE
ncbi:MAG: hypothetical protein K6L76_07350 [Agarilytica sp.]